MSNIRDFKFRSHANAREMPYTTDRFVRRGADIESWVIEAKCWEYVISYLQS